MRARACWWFLACAVAASLVYGVLPVTIWKEPLYNGIITACVVATALGLYRNRARVPKVWYLFLGGLAGICIAEWIWFVDDVRGVEPFPSWSEYSDLTARVLLLVGIAVLVARRGGHRDRTAWADAMVFGVAIGSVLWLVVFRAYVDQPHLTVADRIVTFSYLSLDVAILGGFVVLLLRSRGGVTALRLLAAGVAVLLVTDLLWLGLQVHNAYSSGSLLDVGWPITCAFIAAAALHPTMRAVTEVDRSAPRLALVEAIALGLAIATLPVMDVALDEFHVGMNTLDEVTVAVAAVIVGIGISARFLGLVRLTSEVAAASGERRTEALIRESHDVIGIVGADRCAVYLSPAIERTLGWPVDFALGKPVELLALPEDRALAVELFDRVVAAGEGSVSTFEMPALCQDGSTARFEIVAVNRLQDPEIAGIVLTGRDITERRRLEDELAYRAFHDMLTGLANRRMLLDHVTLAINNRRVDDAPASAVVVIDLDDFKSVNDAYGHNAGDELLVAIGERLTDCVRPGDTVARLGGDEFALLLVDAPTASLDHVANRMLEVLALPLRAGNAEVATSASIGIRVLRQNDTAQLAVRDADIAMYSAKTGGKSRYAVYDLAMGAQTERRLALRADLRGAWRRGEISVAFQPIVDIADGRLRGAEALMRWTHPLYGAVPPAEFVPYAEETGAIRALGLEVLRESCRCAARWRKQHAPDFYISVNVSPVQLDHEFVAAVEDTLRMTKLDAHALVLEVTEGVLLANVAQSVEVLQTLRAQGVRVAIDDFGTGYSSLSYARQLPVDLLKIDRSFTSDLGRDGPTIVPAVMQLAETLCASVVAEGVEREDQAALLFGFGCVLGQGHLYAPALPEATFSDLVKAGEVASTDQPATRARRP
jgi:diguanylate cyclase (GGDEF)-like protein/PAS domain S-box-containing protein